MRPQRTKARGRAFAFATGRPHNGAARGTGAAAAGDRIAPVPTEACRSHAMTTAYALIAPFRRRRRGRLAPDARRVRMLR